MVYEPQNIDIIIKCNDYIFLLQVACERWTPMNKILNLYPFPSITDVSPTNC